MSSRAELNTIKIQNVEVMEDTEGFRICTGTLNNLPDYIWSDRKDHIGNFLDDIIKNLQEARDKLNY